jgi:hypothetical protein
MILVKLQSDTILFQQSSATDNNRYAADIGGRGTNGSNGIRSGQPSRTTPGQEQPAESSVKSRHPM